MEKFSKEEIKQIESNLRLHINYEGRSSGGKYTREMGKLTVNYSGAPGIALSDMLDDYYNQVGVKNLEEALDRLRINTQKWHVLTFEDGKLISDKFVKIE